MSEILPGELSPCGRLRLKEIPEQGWEQVEPAKELGEIALQETVDEGTKQR